MVLSFAEHGAVLGWAWQGAGLLMGLDWAWDFAGFVMGLGWDGHAAG
jgi:hypothetical protein